MRGIVKSTRRVGSLSLLFAWLAFFDTGFAVRTCRSDLIYFRKRGEAQLPATIDGTRVVLSLPDRKVELNRDIVRKMVPGFWPATEWDTRRRQVQANGVEARFAAAWWAIENGLTTEVTAELREIHALDPKHAATARMNAVLDRLDEPCIDPEFARFQKALGIETQRGPRTARAVASPAFRRRSRRANRTAGARDHRLPFVVRRAGRGTGSSPSRRLVSAWFADQKDYLAFLHAENADSVRDHTWLLSSDVERRRRVRRSQQRSPAHRSRTS